MSRRLGFLAALLIWLFLVGPAAAGIQRYTDSRGVIHISNVAPRQTKATRGDGPAGAPEPLAAPMTPAPAPSSSAPLAQSLPAAPRLPENPRTTPAPVTASDFWQLPLQKAAGEIAGTLQPTSEEMRAFSAPKPEIVMAGGRYRDAAGGGQLTSQAPTAAGPESVSWPAENQHSPEMASPAGPPARSPVLAASLPWRPVSYSPGTLEPASWRPTPAPARSAALEGDRLIRRYRDRHGVIHISNVGASETPPPRERTRLPVLAGQETGQGRPPPTRSPSLEDWAAASFQPASWSGEGVPQASKPRRKAKPAKDVLTTAGGIRRWRDKQGVWHIETVEYPWPEGVPVPPRLAGMIKAPATASAPPQVSGPASQPLPRPAAVPGTGIIARRDRQGRLEITNAAPAVSPGRTPIPEVTIAPAELEPLIIEAAQIYGLSPSLVKAVIKEESNFCAWAVSPKGAMGLMQLMPGTADFLGVREPFNPRENILGGCRYLRLLLDFFGGSVPLALAGYNAGYHRVVSNGFQVPAIKETQVFVTRVMERYLANEKRLGLPWI